MVEFFGGRYHLTRPTPHAILTPVVRIVLRHRMKALMLELVFKTFEQPLRQEPVFLGVEMPR